MTHPDLDRVGDSRYVRVTTFRADGSPVATPTWVTREGDRLYVYSHATSGKVRRLRHDPRVRIAPSDWRGKPVGPEVEARAVLLDATGSAAAHRRLIERYGPEYRVFQVGGDLVNRIRRRPKQPEIGIEIELLPTDADDDGRWRVSSGSAYEPLIRFSRAVRVGASVHVSGTGPILPDGSCPDSAYEQARRAFDIAVGALGEVGASAAHVVRTRMYLTAADDWQDVARAHGETFADAMPAATMVVVKELLDPAWKVEVEVEAVIT